MPLIEPGTIQLEGKAYRLARESTLQRAGLGPSARRWRQRRIPQTTVKKRRANVIQEENPLEFAVFQDNWSGGVTSDHNPLEGCIHYTENVDPTSPGVLRNAGTVKSYTKADATEADAAGCVEFDGDQFAIMGRYIMKIIGFSWAEDKDFGAGIHAIDAKVWNNELVVGFDPAGVEAVVFTGSGLDDCTSGGANTSGSCNLYRVEIDGTGTPDTFKWSDDGGSTWEAETVSITGSAQTLQNGVTVTFAATTGHTSADRWDFAAGPRAQTRSTAAAWTRATDATHIGHMSGATENQLWRSTNKNEVSSIGSTDNPLTLASWSAATAIGDDDRNITDMNAYGEKVAVSKEDGLYLGDASAIFPNVLPQMNSTPDAKNGKNTLIRGADIFYPYAQGGLIRYSQGIVEDVSIKNQLTGAEESDLAPGYEITAMAPQTQYVWAATKPVQFPRIEPDSVQFYDASGPTYTDETSDLTDNDDSTVGTFSAMTSSDYIYVGDAAVFYGVFYQARRPNLNTSTLSVEFYDGAWKAFGNDPSSVPIVMHDNTEYGGKTLAQTGAITWRRAPTGWAKTTVNGSTSMYFVRFKVSATLSATVTACEMRLLTSIPIPTVYRGRDRRQGDPWRHSIIWESAIGVLGAATAGDDDVTAMLVGGPQHSVHPVGNSLLCLTRQRMRGYTLPASGYDHMTTGWQAGDAYTFKEDAGMPEVNKDWVSIEIKSRTASSTHTYDVSYRVNEDTTWTSAEASIDTSPKTISLTNVTGRTIQLKIHLDAPSSPTNDQPVEINEIKLVFRPRYTWKNHYTAMLELADAQDRIMGYASEQLSKLEGDQEGGPITLYDPVGREKTVTVDMVEIVEYLQETDDYPILLCQVDMVEK